MAYKGRAGALYLLFFVFLTFSLVTRTFLLVKALPNLDPTLFLLAKIYGVGFFFDCVTFSYFAIPFFLYGLFVPDRVFGWKPAARLGFFIVTYLLMFNLVAEYVFFDEFGSRFNFIAVDYLIYTNEVVRNIWESYPIGRILGALFILNIFILLGIWKYLDKACTTVTTLGQRLKKEVVFLALPLLVCLCVDLSWTSISPNNYANELAGNGIYSLFAAFRANELDYDTFYATRDNGKTLAGLREMLKDEDEQFLKTDGRDVSREVRPGGTEKRLNVIVVVEESLSAEYLGAFGKVSGLTPNLDNLARNSLFFTNLYATGTRTVRGLEAITLSMPPLPGSSVVKRLHNENLFSWGTLMKAKGYDSRFIYGGRGYFDNMNYFFSHNGFTVVDKADFNSNEITFENAWGVCDEDLFRKVVREANVSFSRHAPFFSIVMTTSNHRPFTYPGGRVSVPSGSGREGGVMYADYAIGRLMAEARKQPWFDRTVFVIVADHCAGSARKYALPVENYRIPLIVYSPSNLEPRKVDTVASQIDIAPTVLGLLRFSYPSQFIGRDILDEDVGQPRAFISTYEKLGYLEDGRLLILSPKKGVSCYRFDALNGKTTEMAFQEKLLQHALGYYQGANYLYKHRTAYLLDTVPGKIGIPHIVQRHHEGKRPGAKS
jgi:phosphoglycerol transferase MdoB-like AlkP superfamily enzyme